MSTNQIASAPSGQPVLRARGLALVSLAIAIAVGGLPAWAADTNPPDLVCHQDKSAECGTDWSFDIPTAKDETNVLIEVVSTVTNVASPRCPILFSVTRTWRATDTSTNTAFCNQTVTIVDTEPPNITCEQDKEVQCGSDWAFDIPTAVDKCDLNNVLIEVVSTVTNVASPRCPKIFSVTRTWRATDTCGNASFCNQTVTVVDTEPPNLTCGEDKHAECGDGWAFDIPTAVDLCDLNNVLIEVVATVTNVATPRCPKLFSVTRTWRATDTCGNASFCNQTVTVVDTEPPQIMCGQDKCVPPVPSWMFDIPMVIDKCDGTNLVLQVVATVTNVINPAGPIFLSVTRTWRSTDTCGNASFCNQTVNLVDPALDTNAPVFANVPSNQFFQCFSDLPPPAAVTANDDCSGPIIPTLVSVTNGICPTIITRTWTAVDAFTNSASVTQLITVRDTIPPVIVCPTNLTVQCTNAVPVCPTNLAQFLALGGSASDNCGSNLTYRCTDGPLIGGTCGGTIARTHTVIDDCTNSASCVQIITVRDTIPPVITCPTNLTVSCVSNVPPCPASLAAFLALGGTASDNCNTNLTYSCSDSALVGGACSGTLYRTNTVTDACTNSASCVQIITVNDTIPPSVTGASVDKASLWPPNHKMQDVTVSYIATDNCGTNVNCALSVTSNELINSTGDGDTDPDWEIVDAHHVKLRAERAGTGNGRIYTIAIVCSDCSGNRTTNNVLVVVAHDIKSPVSGAAFKINTSVNFSGTFWDAPGNRHSATWTFDTLSTSGSVTEPSGLKNGTVKGSYKFGTPGVYKITLFIKDQKGVTSWVNTAGDVESIVVIYDPNGGYTIGGGWINSSAGAYAPDPSLVGKLSFGFNSQYIKATNPKGETLVEFLNGGLEFSALTFDYLSISGAKAQFRGFGKINGVSGYNFILTVIDGALAGDGVSKFRIKIWEKISGTIIYDNEPGRSDADDPITPVGTASSILIKK